MIRTGRAAPMHLPIVIASSLTSCLNSPSLPMALSSVSDRNSRVETYCFATPAPNHPRTINRRFRAQRTDNDRRKKACADKNGPISASSYASWDSARVWSNRKIHAGRNPLRP